MPVTAKEVRKETKKDKLLLTILKYIRHGWPSSKEIKSNAKPFEQRKNELSEENGCLMWGLRMVIPQTLRDRLLDELHATHSGIERMKSMARGFIWWPKMDEELSNLVKKCDDCNKHKAANTKVSLHPWTWPERPMQRIHIDLAETRRGEVYFVLVDAHSKWPEVLRIRNSTSSEVIRTLRRIFAYSGLPESMVMDNGPCFASEEFVLPAQWYRKNSDNSMACSNEWRS